MSVQTVNSNPKQSRLNNGQGLVEYALLIALVSLVTIAVLNQVGQSVSATLEVTTCELGGSEDCDCRVLEDVIISEYTCTAGDLFAYTALTNCGAETELSLLATEGLADSEYEMVYNDTTEQFEMTETDALCTQMSSASPPKLYLVSRNDNYDTVRSFPLGANGEPISGFGNESSNESSSSSGSGSSSSGSSGSGDSGSFGSGDSGSGDSGSSGSGSSGSGDSGSGDSGSSGSGDSSSGDSGSSGSGDSGSGDSGSGDSGSSGSGDSGSGDSGSSGSGDVPVNNDPVLDPVTTQTVAEDASLTVTFSATDADDDTLTFSSPTVMPTFMVFDTSSTPTLTLTPDYDDAGTYSVTVAVSDGNGGSDSITFDLVVEDMNQPPVLSSISDQTIAENETKTIPLSATDADGDTLTYGLAGSPPGFVTLNTSPSPTITASPGYSDGGTHEIEVFVGDSSGDSSTQTFDIVVTETNRAPSISAIIDQSVDESTSTTVSITASDADSDTLILTATGLESFMTFTPNDSSASLVINPGGEDSGTYTVTINASDGNGGTDSESFAVVVNDTVTTDSIALLVGDVNSVNSSDTAMKSQLEFSGYVVNLYNDTDTNATVLANNPKLIIISDSVRGADIKARYRDTAIPVMMMDRYLFDDMKMANSANTDSNEKQVRIQNSSHPMAAGLSTGNKTVTTSNRTFNYADPSNNNATIIASIDNNNNRLTIFAYDTGTTMEDNVKAPARRVGFFANSSTAQKFNSTGWQLFDAAVAWAVGG